MKDYFTSPTLRSFYRTAKEKGWVEDNKISKTASNNLSFEPTGDVFRDICVLAEGLRSKGYVKQAEELEEKALAYKTAATHLYRVHDEDGADLLEHAHPEGEYKMENSGEHGVVETTLSAHKKMIDSVKRQPTGKLASIAEEIKKKAQLGEFKGWQGSGVSKDTSDITALLNKVRGNLQGMLNEIGDPNYYQFDIDQVIRGYAVGGDEYTKSFENVASDISNEIVQPFINYSKLIKMIYRGGNVSPNTIAQLITQFAGGNNAAFSQAHNQAVANYLNTMGVNKYANFLDSNNEGSIWTVSQTFGAKSLFGGELPLFLNSNNVMNLANAVHNDVMGTKSRLNIKAVNDYIVNNLKSIKAGLAKIEVPQDFDFSEDPESKKKDAILAEISRWAHQAKNTLNENADKFLEKVMGIFGANFKLFNDYARAFTLSVNELYSAVGKRVYDLFAGPQADAIVHRFVKAEALYKQYISMNPNDPEIEKYRKAAINSYTIAKMVGDLRNRSFQFVRSRLAPKERLAQDFKTANDLDEFSQMWLTVARQQVGAE